jgi:hypothetical protein
MHFNRFEGELLLAAIKIASDLCQQLAAISPFPHNILAIQGYNKAGWGAIGFTNK